jgi:hypothetical protein
MLATQRSTAASALAGALLTLLLTLPQAVRGDHTHDEYDVKAAFIYNFASLVTWPTSAFAQPGTPLTLAILGEADFAPHTEEFFRGRKVGRRAIEVRRISRIEEVVGNHMVFVSASEDDRVPAILEAARNAQVLTIGESEDFARRGGIINFYRRGNKLHFEINRAAADAAGLRISSRLLRLARLVGDEED